jgi:N-acetylneuraminic acid mutarotase
MQAEGLPEARAICCQLRRNMRKSDKWLGTLLVWALIAGSAVSYAGGVDATGTTSGLNVSNSAPEVKSENTVAGPSWIANAPLPFADGVAQAALLADCNGYLYSVGGGRGGALTPTNQVLLYDASQDAWFPRASVPVNPGIRSFNSAVSLPGFIYVFGGFNGTSVLNTTWIYDIANDSWSQGANMPGPRFGSAVTVVPGADGASDQIFISGGFAGLMVGDETNTAWSYDPASDTFSVLASMPIPLGRIHATTVPDLREVHVFAGGFDGQFHLVYFLDEDRWAAGPPMPFGVTDPGVVTVDGLIYVVGGGGAPPRGPGHTQIFDPVSRSWSQGPLMPAPAIDNTTGALANGSIYVVGGFNGVGTSSTNYSLVVQ